jgi:hypothetical protein
VNISSLSVLVVPGSIKSNVVWLARLGMVKEISTSGVVSPPGGSVIKLKLGVFDARELKSPSLAPAGMGGGVTAPEAHDGYAPSTRLKPNNAAVVSTRNCFMAGSPEPLLSPQTQPEKVAATFCLNHCCAIASLEPTSSYRGHTDQGSSLPAFYP